MRIKRRSMKTVSDVAASRAQGQTLRGADGNWYVSRKSRSTGRWRWIAAESPKEPLEKPRVREEGGSPVKKVRKERYVRHKLHKEAEKESAEAKRCVKRKKSARRRRLARTAQLAPKTSGATDVFA